MNIPQSNLTSQIVKQVKSDIGNIYFFNHLAIVEINDGVHLDSSNVQQTITTLINYFGQDNAFGLIANRTNSYSISLLDINKIKPILPNIVAYGVVSYNLAGRMNAEIENNFCKTQNISFRNLYIAFETINQRVIDKVSLTLN